MGSAGSHKLGVGVGVIGRRGHGVGGRVQLALHTAFEGMQEVGEEGGGRNGVPDADGRGKGECRITN